MRGVRGFGLRAILTLFIVVMSAGVAPLYAQDAGEGTPVSEVPAPTEEAPVDPAPEPPAEEPADPAPEEGEDPPVSEPGEGEDPVVPAEGDVPQEDEGDVPPVDEPVEEPVVDEGVVETPVQSSSARNQPQQLGIQTFTVTTGDSSVANTLPAGATWTITPSPGGEPFSGTWTEATELPTTVSIGNRILPTGNHTLTISAGDAFEPYSAPFTGEGRDFGTFSLTPVVPAALEEIEAEINQQCSVTATSYGAQLRRAEGAETATFHFSDGTQVEAPFETFRYNPPTLTTYRTGPIEGKTLVRVTTVVDTAEYPNWTFRTTVGPCPSEYTVTGTVTDAESTEPIAGATVVISGTELTATTETDGTYNIPQVPRGQYDFVFSASGYESTTVNAFVNQATSRVVNAQLDPLPTFAVTGTVTDTETSEPIAGASVVIEGTSFTATTGTDGAYSIEGVTEGTYSFTFSADSFEPLTVSDQTINADNTVVDAALTPLDAETFPVTIVGATSDDGSAEGATVTIDDGMDEVLPPLSFAPMAIVAGGSLDADNTYTTELVAGEYTVIIDATEQGYGVAEATFTVPLEGDVVVELTAEAPATGTVAVQKVYCEDLDEVIFNPGEDVIGDDCATGAATFTFYLVGDDSGEPNGQLEVFESGAGTIDLAVGTYEVVEEGTQASATIEVVADEVTSVSVANPGVAPAPRDGTVNVSVFTCTNIDQVIFSSDSFMSTFALPTFEPACEPGAATLSFYLIGDGTDDVQQLAVEGTGSITLAPGNYEVVEEGSQARTAITVFAGDFINLDVQLPAGGEVVPGSSVNIVKFYCDTATEVEFLAYGMAEYADRVEDAGAPDCVSGPATFTFYLVGDGTDDYAQLWVNGSGSIGLAPGMYVVVEEETQAQFELEVLEGENTLLIVTNPMPEDGVPGPDDPDNGDGDDNGTDDGAEDADDPGDGTDGVTELPSTGHGSGGDNSAMLMISAAAASMLAGAGAFVLRREQA